MLSFVYHPCLSRTAVIEFDHIGTASDRKSNFCVFETYWVTCCVSFPRPRVSDNDCAAFFAPESIVSLNVKSVRENTGSPMTTKNTGCKDCLPCMLALRCGVAQCTQDRTGCHFCRLLWRVGNWQSLLGRLVCWRRGWVFM